MIPKVLKDWKKYFDNHLIKAIIVFLALAALALLVFSAPPSYFPSKVVINIPPNSSLTQVADLLEKNNIIKSEFLFKADAVLMRGQKGIQAGNYLFEKPQSIYTVAYRLIHGQSDIAPIKVTIPEGSTMFQIGAILLKDIPGFDAPYFIKLAENDGGQEGYLFPDTYYLPMDVTPEEVISTMEDNFNQKIKDLSGEITASKRSLKDIIIMASIVQNEARTTDTRKIIAGILWKRLDQGLLLEVDAPLAYIDPNNSGNITSADTKIDSPYNTYIHKGLPIGPISNPGLDAIEDTLSPTATPYYYYLSDKNGVMHYAVTYEQHLANIAEYLN